MAKYNSFKKYNSPTSKEGMLYNSAQALFLVKIFEALKVSDEIKQLTVSNIIYEKTNVFEGLIDFVVNSVDEQFSTIEKVEVTALQKVMENLGLSERFGEVLVMWYLKEQTKLLEQCRVLNSFISTSENFKIEEIDNITALTKLADKLGLAELASSINNIFAYEFAKMSDRPPRKAVGDFIIGNKEDLDQAWQYFQPLDMVFDKERSEIQVMPQTRSTYIEMPYVDGSITEDTVYENRMFSIMLWSEIGLNTAEKEQLKCDIARLLDSTKKTPKKLIYKDADIAFDVKYSGKADIKEAPSFVKAILPFEATPYGYPLFEQEVYGSGLLVNRGDKEASIINTISGGCKNPSFQIGKITYTWEGTVPLNSTLIIDHDNLTAYLQDTSGKTTNAMASLKGEFQRIPIKSSVQITANNSTKPYIKTTVKESILWGGDM